MAESIDLNGLTEWWKTHQPQRIVVIGPSGSGKTTMCLQLSQVLGCPGQDLDELYWLPNWQGRPDEAFRALIRNFVQQERWVLGGNYSRTQDISWPRADLIVWLHLPLWLALGRVIKRTLTRIYTQELICNGNRENWYNSFMMPDSLLRWLIRTYRPQQERYLARMLDPQMPPFLVLKTPQAVKRFYQAVALVL